VIVAFQHFTHPYPKPAAVYVSLVKSNTNLPLSQLLCSKSMLPVLKQIFQATASSRAVAALWLWLCQIAHNILPLSLHMHKYLSCFCSRYSQLRELLHSFSGVHAPLVQAMLCLICASLHFHTPGIR